MVPVSCPAFPRYHRPRWPKGPWPDECQLLLLKACLLQTDEAVAAWKTYRSLIWIENIDHSSERLLPLLSHHLAEVDVEVSDRNWIASIVQRHLQRHEEHMRCMGNVLKLFADAGIEALLLKGAALNLQVYPAGARPMADVDIVVPRESARRAMQVLREHGWESSTSSPERLIDVVHGCQFEVNHRDRLDLHWDFFHGRPLSSAQQKFLWHASTPVRAADATARVLSPTHLLLHTCVHGARWCATPPLRWLADACLIIQRWGEHIDWDELVRVAARLELALYVWPTLVFVERHLGAVIPAATVRQLQQAHSSASGRLQHCWAVRQGPGVHPFWTSLPLHLLGYWMERKHGRRVRFDEYLQLQHQFDRPLHTYFPSLLRLQKAAAREAVVLWARKIWRRLSGAGRELVVSMGFVPRWRTQGFYELQRWHWRLFRWSKPEASILFQDWPGHDCRVVIVLAGRTEWLTSARDLKIKFNGRRIPRDRIETHGTEIHLEIGSKMHVPGRQQKLSFRCQPIVLADGRKVGVPICSIHITERGPKGDLKHGSEILSIGPDVPGTPGSRAGEHFKPPRVA